MLSGSVLERPETALEDPSVLQVPGTLPRPVIDAQPCPKGGEHDWQPDGNRWKCSKCQQTSTL